MASILQEAVSPDPFAAARPLPRGEPAVAADPALLALEDEHAVLSAYVRSRRHAPAERSADLRVLRDDLRVLSERARTWRPEQRRALRRRLAELEIRFGQLARGAGPGTALFAGLSSGAWIERPLDVGVAPSVRLGREPRIGPLLAALQDGRPAGFVVLEPSRVELRELRGETVGEAQALHPDGESLAGVLQAVAHRRGWDAVVATGHRGLMSALGRAPAWTHPRLVGLPRDLAGRHARTAGAAREVLLDHRRREVALEADDALRALQAQGADVTNVRGLHDALAQRRVARLYADRACRPADRAARYSRGTAPTPRASSGEQLIRAALSAGTPVVMVDPPPSWRAAGVPGALAAA